jgi:hypothetical protein
MFKNEGGIWLLVLFPYCGCCITNSLILLAFLRSYGRLQSSWSVIWWVATIDSMQSYSWHEIHICCIMPAIWYPETIWWSTRTGYSEIDDNVSLDLRSIFYLNILTWIGIYCLLTAGLCSFYWVSIGEGIMSKTAQNCVLMVFSQDTSNTYIWPVWQYECIYVKKNVCYKHIYSNPTRSIGFILNCGWQNNLWLEVLEYKRIAHIFLSA